MGEKRNICILLPGELNLIGEHIDYNGGRVFPCALSFGTYLLVARRKDKRIAFASMNSLFEENTIEMFSNVNQRNG